VHGKATPPQGEGDALALEKNDETEVHVLRLAACGLWTKQNYCFFLIFLSRFFLRCNLQQGGLKNTTKKSDSKQSGLIKKKNVFYFSPSIF
jgi:hypothetical protein